MEEQLNELRVQLESLTRMQSSIITALLNIKGFYVEEADGSEQGLIKFGEPKAQVEAVAK